MATNIPENKNDDKSHQCGPENDEVEKILKKRIQNGKTEYMLKWKAYGNENMWISKEDIKGCISNIVAYEVKFMKVEKENDGYSGGTNEIIEPVVIEETEESNQIVDDPHVHYFNATTDQNKPTDSTDNGGEHEFWRVPNQIVGDPHVCSFNATTNQNQPPDSTN